MDEVTNHLDVRARFEVLQLVQGLVVTKNSVIHELDSAVRYCDQLLVLRTVSADDVDQCSVVSSGDPTTVLSPQVLREVFGVRARAHPLGVEYDAHPLAE